MKKTVYTAPHLVSMYDRISTATCALIFGLAFTGALVWFRETVVSEAGRASVAVAIVVMVGGTVFNSISTLLGRRDRELGKLKQQLPTFFNNS